MTSASIVCQQPGQGKQKGDGAKPPRFNAIARKVQKTDRIRQPGYGRLKDLVKVTEVSVFSTVILSTGGVAEPL